MGPMKFGVTWKLICVGNKLRGGQSSIHPVAPCRTCTAEEYQAHVYSEARRLARMDDVEQVQVVKVTHSLQATVVGEHNASDH